MSSANPMKHPRTRVLGVPIREPEGAQPPESRAHGHRPDQTVRFSPRISAERYRELAELVAEGGTARDLERRLVAYADRILREHPGDLPAERASALILSDLLRQGWTIFLDGGDIWISTVDGAARVGERAEQAKRRVRETLLAFRDVQLADSAVRAFIREMEKPRPVRGEQVSVLDLVDDGHDLAVALADASRLPPSFRSAALDAIIRPVIEVAAADQYCEHTGLPLYDIWRYFRHTWSLEYRPTPGRSLAFLIRNAARPRAPVMGIASIANATLQLGVRDQWIGWSTSAVIKSLHLDPLRWPQRRAAMLRTLRDARGGIREDDLLRSAGDVAGKELERRLRALADAARAERARALRARTQKEGRGEDTQSLRRLPTSDDGSVDWQSASGRSLFVAKRAETLAAILFALREMEALPDDPQLALSVVEARVEARRGITIAAREIRKVGLSSRLLDVNVCGAVPPYRELLVGKLVALAMASGEVSAAYRRRYDEQLSEIGSQLAGRPVSRDPDICLLTTTSLYGAAASQYNRLRIRADMPGGGAASIHWRDLGLTEGWGTTHFSEATIAAFRTLVVAAKGTLSVNNVFGEGQSPRLRQAREGFDLLGLDQDFYLKHRHSRRVYGLELCEGARDALAFNASASEGRPTLEAIAVAWRDRWLSRRVLNSDIRARVAEQGPQTLRTELLASQAGARVAAPDQPLKLARRVVPRENTMAEQSSPQLIQSLYRALGACADHHSDEMVSRLHIATPIDAFIRENAPGRVIFVTGNPGDGKTHLLRRLASDLEKSRVDVCLDANERSNEELIERIRTAARRRTGGLAIAINEGILVQLLRSAVDEEWAPGVRRQLLSPLVYRAESQDDVDQFLVLDLSLRNNLSATVVQQALSTLVSMSAPCASCPGAAGCSLQANAVRVAHPEVAERIGELLDAVASVGVHATMRDLQGFLALLLTGEQQCDGGDGVVRPYWVNAFVGGEGSVFDTLRRFDPATITHPLLDDLLWRRADDDASWSRPWPRPLDANLPLSDRLASFREVKRRALFEHREGRSLLTSSSQVDRELRDLVRGGAGAVRRMVSGLNRFFDRDEKGMEILYLWMTHRYDANAPRYAAAILPFPSSRLEVLVPQLRPTLRAAFPEYRPDHVIFVADDMEPLDGLRVDRTLLDALLAAEGGMPANFRRGEPEARIATFISRLAKRHGDPSRHEEVQVWLVDRDTGKNVPVSVDLRNRRYMTQGG